MQSGQKDVPFVAQTWLERDGRLLNITDELLSNDDLNEALCKVAVDELHKVEIVYAFNNRLVEIPQVFSGWPLLNGIYCGKNRITKLPKWICERPIDSLFIFDNDLSYIPSTITKLSSLTSLDIRSVSVGGFHFFFFFLPPCGPSCGLIVNKPSPEPQASCTVPDLGS